MAMTGFDPQLVSNSIGNIEKSYDELVNALGTQMQKDFVDSMANYWACKQAQDFFRDAFKPAIDSLLKSSYDIFQSVVTSMNSAAVNWARETDSQWTTKTFNGVLKSINISNIKENINGVRGVDEKNANVASNKLTTILYNAENALVKAQQAVRNSGFAGRGMETQLVDSLQTIKNNIKNATQQLTTSTKQAINETISDYGNLAGNVETAFKS